MQAKALVEEYLTIHKLNRVDDPGHLKAWLENRLTKRMRRPLIVAQGSGGGQKYKLFWDTFDDEGNQNEPVYYYTATKAAIDKLLGNNHLPLQHWVDDTSDYLKY